MHILGLVRIGRDAESRYTSNGTPVASFSGAFNFGRKDERKVQWVEFSVWGDRAEKLAPYLLKGAQVFVSASEPHVETYEKRDGGAGWKFVARVDSLEFAGAKADRESGGDGAGEQPQRAAPAARAKAPAGADPFGDMTDDIPF
jgi:single-strand DNA-binding protein